MDAPFCSDHLTHLNRKGGQGTANSSMFSLKTSANLMPKFAKRLALRVGYTSPCFVRNLDLFFHPLIALVMYAVYISTIYIYVYIYTYIFILIAKHIGALMLLMRTKKMMYRSIFDASKNAKDT